MTPMIEAVSVVAHPSAALGREAWFVAAHGGGQTGWYGPVSDQVACYVRTVLSGPAVGMPALDHDRLHAALRHAAASDATAVASWAVGTVDCAVWDLGGQLTGLPVARLLAPEPQMTVPVYASWLSLDIALPGSVAAVRQVGHGGWPFTKWGLRRGDHEDAGGDAARLASAVVSVTAMLGKAAAFDAVFTWDATLAELVAGRLERASVLWLEDPLPDQDAEACRMLASKLPLALGERLYLHSDEHSLLRVRPRAFTLDVVACGGLTRAIELVTASNAIGIPAYPHGRSFVPGLHLGAAFPHAVPAVEYRLQWEPRRQRLYARPWLPEEGVIGMRMAPGLGATPGSR